jgi:hypothetical protein
MVSVAEKMSAVNSTRSFLFGDAAVNTPRLKNMQIKQIGNIIIAIMPVLN